MESIYDQFATDPTAEMEGVILPFGEAGELRLRRAGGANQEFQRRGEQYHRRWQRKMDQGILPHEEARADMIQIFVDTVIIGGWFRDRNGEKVEVTNNRAALVKFLTELPELFIEVKRYAEEITAFREISREDDAKNSETFSAIDSNGQST